MVNKIKSFYAYLTRDKNLVFELSRRHIKTQYRGSVLGFIWTVLNPLLSMLVMWFVFSSIFGRSVYYPIYLLCGNILFSALRTSTTSALDSLHNNRSLLTRTKVNSYVFPCAITVSSLVNFFLSLVALIPFMIWLSVQQQLNIFTYRLFFIILMLPAFWMFEYGIGLFLSVLYIFFKDIKHLYHVFVLLWQYLTPIFYTIDRFSDGSPAKTVIKLNPMFHFTNYLRECVYMGATGTDPMLPNDVMLVTPYIPYWHTLGILYACGALSMLIGYAFYKLLNEKVMVKL